MHLIHVYISQVLNVDETSRPRSRLPSNKTVETNPKISTPICVRKKNRKGSEDVSKNATDSANQQRFYITPTGVTTSQKI